MKNKCNERRYLPPESTSNSISEISQSVIQRLIVGRREKRKGTIKECFVKNRARISFLIFFSACRKHYPSKTRLDESLI